MNDLNPTSRIEIDEPNTSVDRRPFVTVLQGESLGLVMELKNERTIIGRGTQQTNNIPFKVTVP